jgi:hypothetical protein
MAVIIPFFRYTKEIMKATRLEKTYIVLLMVIFGGIVLHAPLSVGLGILFPHFDLLIKSWKEILMVIAMPMAVTIVTRHALWKELIEDWLFRLIALYVLLHIVLSVALYQGTTATVAGLAIDLRYVLFFCLVYIAIRAMPRYRRRMIQIGVVGAFIVVGFATVQLFLPADILSHIGYGKTTIAPYLTVDKNPNYIRENSTLRGPNPLGAYATIVLGVLAAVLVRKREWLKSKRIIASVCVLAVCSVVALWVSYSRSALIAGILAVCIVFVTSFMRKTIPRKVWIVALVVVLILAGTLLADKGSSFVSNVILHENPNGGSSVSSNAGHVSSLEVGWSQLVHQPLGAGVGSTGSASLFSNAPEIIENQYLFIGHETGWLGLVLFSAIFIMILVRLWHKRNDWLALGIFASGIGLAFIGLLLPVWVDDTVSIVWWGLAAIALGGEHARRSSK